MSTSLFRTLATLSVAAFLTLFTAETEAGHHEAHKPETVVDIAAGNEDFETLTKAVKAAGLVEALSGDGPFTVLAPTDSAFGKLPEKTLKSLLKPENKEKLQAILTYHVAPGKLKKEDVVRVDMLKTLNGAKIRLSQKDGKVFADDARIVKTDLMAGNGVVHVIDAVLMPPAGDSAEAKIIREAIQRGAPLYNAGQHMACVAVYEVAAISLLEMGDKLPEESRKALKKAMKKSAESSSPSDRAWALRHGMDEAMKDL